MSTGSKVMDRGALYYPYIHVRDEEWLKATLLCFPFVDRMVPEGYEVNDGTVARTFAAKQGRLGRKMLGRRDLGDDATEHAREVLLEKLQGDLSGADLPSRFSREAAKRDSANGDDSAFQIHEYKMGSQVLRFLKSHSMAWDPPYPERGNARWYAVHPILGEAIMSTNAVALAKAHDLEIVTSDGPVHEALLGSDPDDVYDVLIRRRLLGMPRGEGQKVNDLLRFVIVNGFDLKKLSVDDIVELNLQRKDLAALKSALLAEVDDLGAVPDREMWNDVLRLRAKEVVEEWGERSSLRSLVTRADASEIAGEFEDVLKQAAPALLAGGAATALLGMVPGLVVGVVFGAVHLAKSWQDSRRPFRFLSLLTRKGARSRHFLEGSPA